MASYDFGKREIIQWIYRNFDPDETCLDVGACDGKYSDLLGHYLEMDGIEIFEPNILKYNLDQKYKHIVCDSIVNFEYEWYDLIIFGDVLEHMTVEDAQKVLKYAEERCRDYLIGIPFLYPQNELYGNKWERHIQDDLTPEIFSGRYPNTELILEIDTKYAYYHKANGGIANGQINRR